MKPVLSVFVLACALSGCTLRLPFDWARPQASMQRTEVLAGSLSLAAPAGYCVDPHSRQDNPDTAFVLWGNCAAIGKNPKAAQPSHKALLSVTIGPPTEDPAPEAFADYEAFFRSDAGRAALARSGLAGDVEILDVAQQDQLLLLKIADQSAASIAPISTVYWRAITGLGGRVAALSVLPIAGSDLDDESQVALLQAFEGTLRAAN